jgi:glycosyltransferase involved in cell wall biosynthesis
MVVVHLHINWQDWIPSRSRWIMRHAAGIVGVSRYTASTAITEGGCSTERVYYVVNGIDPEEWDPETNGDAIRDEFGVSSEVTLLTIVARMFVWKGHLDLLRSLSMVKQQTGRFHLLVVGEDYGQGAPGRPPLSKEMRTLISELGLEGHVTFAGRRKDVASIMAATDIYTMPSFQEPLGLVFLEAMAMRKPVVALRSGGAPEAIVDGETGFLCEPGDIGGFAGRLLRLMGDADLRRRMGAAGRARVESYLNARRMARDMEKVYVSVLSGRRLSDPVA